MNKEEIINAAIAANYSSMAPGEQDEYIENTAKNICGIDPEDKERKSLSWFADQYEDEYYDFIDTANQIIDILNAEFGSNVDYYD